VKLQLARATAGEMRAEVQRAAQHESLLHEELVGYQRERRELHARLEQLQEAPATAPNVDEDAGGAAAAAAASSSTFGAVAGASWSCSRRACNSRRSRW